MSEVAGRDPGAHQMALQDGWTPLHFAAYGGSLQVLNELLSYGADATVADKVPHFPAYLLSCQKHRYRDLARRGRGMCGLTLTRKLVLVEDCA